MHTQRRLLRCCFAALFVAVLLSSQCAHAGTSVGVTEVCLDIVGRGGVVDPAPPPPGATVKSAVCNDPTETFMLAWYPADDGDTSAPLFPYLQRDYELALKRMQLNITSLLDYRGTARYNASPITGRRYPLIALSHDSCLQPAMYAFLGEYLALQGYVVVAPNHYGSSQLDWTANPLLDGCFRLPQVLTDLWYEYYFKSLWWRPLDIIAAINRVLPFSQHDGDPSWFKELVDPGAVVTVLGHGLGGLSAFYVSGVDLPECSFGILPLVGPQPQNYQAIVEKVCTYLTSTFGNGPYLFKDQRLVASVVYDAWMAPSGLQLDTSDLFTRPLFFSTDTSNNPGTVVTQQRYSDISQSQPNLPKAEVILNDGGNRLFTDLCQLPQSVRNDPQASRFTGDTSFCDKLMTDIGTYYSTIQTKTDYWAEIFVRQNVALARDMSLPNLAQPASTISSATSSHVAELAEVTSIDFRVAFIATTSTAFAIIACLTLFIMCCDRGGSHSDWTKVDDDSDLDDFVNDEEESEVDNDATELGITALDDETAAALPVANSNMDYGTDSPAYQGRGATLRRTGKS